MKYFIVYMNTLRYSEQLQRIMMMQKLRFRDNIILSEYCFKIVCHQTINLLCDSKYPFCLDSSRLTSTRQITSLHSSGLIFISTFLSEYVVPLQVVQ